jgi:hypothetical protein
LACLLGLSLLLPGEVGAQKRPKATSVKVAQQQPSKATSVKVAQQQPSKAPSVNIAQQQEEAQTPPAASGEETQTPSAASEEETQTPSAASEEEESPEARARAAEEARRKKVEQETRAILAEKGGVLLPMGAVTLEPSFNYTHFSGNRIVISGFTIFQAIVIGTIQVEELKRDIITGAFTLRYGLLDRLQIDARVPYLWRKDREVRPSGAGTTAEENPVTTIEDNGIGDVEAGLSLHALRGRNWLPDVILNVRGKFPTGRDPFELDTKEVNGVTQLDELPMGTGFYGLSGGFTLVKASDPVVFFGTFNYYWNIERDIDEVYGEIDPGDSYEYILGMAVALSERVSLSLSFQNNLVRSTQQNGVKIPDSNLNAASLFLGASYRFGRHGTVYANVGLGLTEDTPDFQVQLNLPFTFSLF